MKTDVTGNYSDGGDPAKILTAVLGQNQHVKTLVDECVADLSSANATFRNALAERRFPAGIAEAMEKNASSELRVREIATKLYAVNQALKHEVLERQVLAHQLADVMEHESAAYHAAFHDSLTGLPNRALFNDRLEHGLAQAKRHLWSLSVMFVDLDDFKIVNDVHGHDAGDHVLRTIARRLQETTRVDDTISRHGGDEFVCMLMEVPDEQAVSLIAEKIINAIQLPCDNLAANPNIRPRIKASIGIAMYPQDGTTVAALVKSADIAMYRAKRDKCGYSFARYVAHARH
ncbi:MAG: GGDEF domain-containing protein [Burkholderiales bacterium]|nr:GGDEF domain-containing protein [Burkholderiales bacterium]